MYMIHGLNRHTYIHTFQCEERPFPETCFTAHVKDNVDTVAWGKSMKNKT